MKSVFVLTQSNGDGLEGKAGKISGKELSWVCTKRQSHMVAKQGGRGHSCIWAAAG